MDAHDPRHGTYAGAQTHWREGGQPCDDCRKAYRRYQNRHVPELKRGLRRTTPSQPVTAHLRDLIASGMTAGAIAAQSGVSRAAIQDLISRPRPRLRTDNAEALLATKPADTYHGRLPSLGTIRRVQALGRLGWSMTAIANTARQIDPTLPMSSSTLRQLLSEQPATVRYRTAHAVQLAYAELSMRIPELSRQTSQVRNRAERKGWPPPLAWDNIDDPDEQPIKGSHGQWLSPDEAEELRMYRRTKHAPIDPNVIDRVLSGEWSLHANPAERVEICRRFFDEGRGSTLDLERLTGWRVARYYRKKDAA